MVNKKPYGLENEKLAGNPPRKGMPLVLDDRLISKQYIKDKVDAKVDNTAFGSSWNDVTDVAPSKEVLYEYLNSLTPSSDMWTKKENTSSTNIRAYKTGNYAIGPANFTGDSAWEKLYVAGSIKATGNFVMATEGSKIGPEDGEITLHSTNGALLPTKFMIGTGTAGVPLEISLAGSPATKADGTGIIQAGPDSGANLGIGADTIQARSGEDGAELKLNPTGGTVTIGSTGVTTTISGNLNVVGTATTTLSETVNIKDSNILLNSDLASDTAPSLDAGITVERGSATDASIIWNETADKWSVSDGTDTFDLAHSSHAPVTLSSTNTASGLTLSGQEIGLADKFVQHGGDAMTGALTIGDSDDQSNNSGAGTTNLTVWGGPSDGNPAVVVNGYLQADNKSFNIEHPTKKGKRLVHGCLEGPEFGIYQRGTIKSMHQIEEIALPEYWKVMVGDYTVSLTPHGNYNVWVEEKNQTMIKIKSSADAIDGPWSCEWIAIGRRTDCSLEVEQDAK